MNIAIVGTGYVGLVSGTCFAEMGVNVTCVDIDEEKVDKLRRGVIPIYEPGLDEMVRRNVDAGRLRFTTDLTEVLDDVEVVFSAVGTPPDEDGSADLKYVLAVAETFGHEDRGCRPHDAGHGREGEAESAGGARQAWGGCRVRRGVQSRVFERGRGHKGFHDSRPSGGRNRERAGEKGHVASLQTVHALGRTHDIHRYPVGRDDKVCAPRAYRL